MSGLYELGRCLVAILAIPLYANYWQECGQTRQAGNEYVGLVSGKPVRGKDPLTYLKDIRTQLPRLTNQDDLRQLTPRLWQPTTS